MYVLTQFNTVTRISDGACIPFAEGNSDFVEYQQWLAEGNVPEPACPAPNQRIAEIDAALELIDKKSIRAIREGNQQRIDDLEAQAQILRAERRGLV